MKHICWRLAVILISLPVVHTARAGCINNPQWDGMLNVIVIGGSIVADPAMPVGQVIKEGRLTMPKPSRQTAQYVPVGRCTAGVVEIFAANHPATADSNVFSTDVAGIGYRMIYPNNDQAPQAYMNPTNNYVLYYPQGDFVFQFVKTGPIKPGVIPAGLYGFDMLSPGGANFVQFRLYTPITVTVPTCHVTAGSVLQTVRFGDVASSVFSGVGSTSESRPFSIRLQCDSAVSAVGLTFDATPDPSGLPGTLRVDGGDSAATGVGIQVLENDQPLDWHQHYPLNLASGAAYIDMSARYIQTDKSIRGGAANGVMTFTITY